MRQAKQPLPAVLVLDIAHVLEEVGGGAACKAGEEGHGMVGAWAVTRSAFPGGFRYGMRIHHQSSYLRPLSPDRLLRHPYPPLLLLQPLGGKFLNILSMSLFKDWTFLSDLFDRSRSALPRQASCLLLVVKISTTRLPMG